MITKLLKYATIFCKTADLQENMSLRIFHALIPSLIQDIHSKQEIDDIQKFMAFDLIPGAKEILELGANAIAYEFDISNNTKLKSEIQLAINNKDYITGLNLAIPGFLSEFPMASGGKVWSNIAKQLLILDSRIKKVESSQNPNDAISLSTHLDVIDHLSHNTGSLLEKLVQQENKSIGPESQEKYQQLLRLRDISKMEGNYPTSILMQQYLPSVPKEYRQWYMDFIRLNPHTSPEIREQLGKYLGRDVGQEDTSTYDLALELLAKTKQRRELSNYLTHQVEDAKPNTPSKEVPKPPSKK